MFIFALTPVVAATFPALVPLVLAAAGGLGYKVVTDMKEGGDLNAELRQRLYESTTITLKVDELVMDSMEQEVARAEALFFEKGAVTISVMKDERNTLRIQASGPKDYDRKLLEQQGGEFLEELARIFAQNRVVEQLERMNAEVVEEEQLENGEVRMKIRRWS